MNAKVIYGTLIGASIGSTMAIIGNLIRSNTHHKNKERILELYPRLSQQTTILNNMVKIYDICAPEDFSALCTDLNSLIEMERDNRTTSYHANRLSEKCIKKLKQLENILRKSTDINLRLIADELEVEEFECACRDIIHNMLLQSPRRQIESVNTTSAI